VCTAVEDRKNQQKTLYFGSSGSFKVIDVDTTEKLVTSACCDKQHAHSYLQLFSRKTGQQRLNIKRLLGRYRFLMPSWAGFLEPRKSRLGRWNLRSMLKTSYAASPCLSQSILVQFALEMCLAAQNGQKIHKTAILAFKVIQGHEFSGNWEPVYDFLLVNNSNLGPIAHRYWDTATYWLKITNFSFLPPLPHLAPSFGVTPSEIMEKLSCFCFWN